MTYKTLKIIWDKISRKKKDIFYPGGEKTCRIYLSEKKFNELVNNDKKNEKRLFTSYPLLVYKSEGLHDNMIIFEYEDYRKEVIILEGETAYRLKITNKKPFVPEILYLCDIRDK